MGAEVKTYYTFGGCDMLVLINGKGYGEIEKLDFNSTRKGKEIELTFSLFPGLDYFDQTEINGVTLLQIYANEYGDKYFRKFEGLKFVGEKGIYTVDDISVKTTFIYSCDSYTRLDKMNFTVEDAMKGNYNV